MIRRKHPILPHEFVFGGFLFIMWVRLALRFGVGDRDALVYLAHLVAACSLVAWCRAESPQWQWRVRLLFYPVAMNLLFMHLKTALPRLVSWRADSALREIDQWLVGGNLSVRLETYAHPAITEFLSFCYLLFFPYLLFSIVYYGCARLALAKQFYAGLFSIYGLGFLGYTLLPAAGPYVAMTSAFSAPLDGWGITRINDFVVRAGSNGVDVFPSLHCAVSGYMLFFDWSHRRARFWAYLAPCVGLWLSTIYLRYHYAIDCLAGFGLTMVGLALVRFCRTCENDPSHARVLGIGSDPA